MRSRWDDAWPEGGGDVGSRVRADQNQQDSTGGSAVVHRIPTSVSADASLVALGALVIRSPGRSASTTTMNTPRHLPTTWFARLIVLAIVLLTVLVAHGPATASRL